MVKSSSSNEVEKPVPDTAIGALAAKDPRVFKPKAIAVATIGIMFTLFHLFTGFSGILEPYAQLTITLSVLMIFSILLHPLGRKSWYEKPSFWFLIDLLLIVGIIYTQVYIIQNFYDLTIFRTSSANVYDVIVGTIYIIVLLEVIRRVLGYPILVLCLFFLIQNLTAEHWPGWFFGPSVPWKMSIEVNFLQDNGIFAEPMKVVGTYLILFMIFGAFLIKTGGGDFFVKLANSIAGPLVGGPGKVAVIGSSLVGMIQGAATSNAAIVGTITIPMMKKAGFSARVAAAIEAIASSGGQLMPPIMGASAFVMAEYLGVPYIKIAASAVIPAVAYYLAAYLAVHYEALKANLKGLPQAEVPPLGKTLKEGGHILLPLVFLVILLALGLGIASATAYTIFITVVVTMLFKQTRLTPQRFLETLELGARNSVIVGIACAAAGIVIGTFYVSGLADTLASQIILGSGGNILIAGLIAALVSLVLGMAMPTVAVYVTVLLIGIPALIKMGAPVFSAHFFCFYYGLLSAITPPVALAAYVTAGIAGDKPMNVAATACRIALPLYILPFGFLLNPSILLQAPVGHVVISALGTFGGVYFLASGLSGYLFCFLSLVERIILVIGGFLLITQNYLLMLVGLIVGGIGFSLHRIRLTRMRRGENSNVEKL